MPNGAVTTHTIHISAHNGQLNFVHEAPDFTNPQDGPIVNVDPGDTVRWRGRSGLFFVVTFDQGSPFEGNTVLFFGPVETNSGDGVVRHGIPKNTRFKYSVLVVGTPDGNVTADPDIVVT